MSQGTSVSKEDGYGLNY